MGTPPDGFEHIVQGDAVVILHHGRVAATLRGSAAQRFLARIEAGDAQQVMARVTGDYKRGNERTARERSRRD
jgi:antitoxin (DNA-binding transcriptional repressor) of toxin-antitoxin stability system